jgi:hypothetical protein
LVKLNGVAGRTVVGCFVAAGAIFAILTVVGETRAGAAVALGLVLGSINGALAERALGAGVSFRLSSIPRLGVLSAIALGVGFLLGANYAWLVIVGVAAAQAVLVAVAAKSLLRR